MNGYVNFGSPRIEVPNALANSSAEANKSMGSAFDALMGIGAKIQANKKNSAIADVMGKVMNEEFNDSVAMNRSALSQLLQIPGMTTKEAYAAISPYGKNIDTQVDDVLAREKYNLDAEDTRFDNKLNRLKRDDQVRQYGQNHNLALDKFGELQRHNRAGEVQMFEGANGAQYAYDKGEATMSPLDYIAQHESRGRYDAKNPNSTAYGKYQFIDETRAYYANKAGMTDAQAKTPEGQEFLMKMAMNDYTQQLEGLGIPVNNKTLLAIHQMGYPDFKSFISGNLSDKTRKKLEHLSSYKMGLSQLTEDGSGKPNDQILSNGSRRGDVKIHESISRDPISGAETKNFVAVDSTSGKILSVNGIPYDPNNKQQQQDLKKYALTTQKDRDTIGSLQSSLTMADVAIKDFDLAAIGPADTFAATIDNITGLNFSVKTSVNKVTAGRWNVVGGKLVKAIFGGNASDRDRVAIMEMVPQVGDSEQLYKDKTKNFWRMLRAEYLSLRSRMERSNPGYMKQLFGVKGGLPNEATFPAETEANLGTPQGRDIIINDISNDPAGVAKGAVAGFLPTGMIGDMYQSMTMSPEDLATTIPYSQTGNSTGRGIGNAATDIAGAVVGGGIGGKVGSTAGAATRKVMTKTRNQAAQEIDSKVRPVVQKAIREAEDSEPLVNLRKTMKSKDEAFEAAKVEISEIEGEIKDRVSKFNVDMSKAKKGELIVENKFDVIDANNGDFDHSKIRREKWTPKQVVEEHEADMKDLDARLRKAETRKAEAEARGSDEAEYLMETEHAKATATSEYVQKEIAKSMADSNSPLGSVMGKLGLNKQASDIGKVYSKLTSAVSTSSAKKIEVEAYKELFEQASEKAMLANKSVDLDKVAEAHKAFIAKTHIDRSRTAGRATGALLGGATANASKDRYERSDRKAKSFNTNSYDKAFDRLTKTKAKAKKKPTMESLGLGMKTKPTKAKATKKLFGKKPTEQVAKELSDVKRINKYIKKGK